MTFNLLTKIKHNNRTECSTSHLTLRAKDNECQLAAHSLNRNRFVFIFMLIV